jgi:hypothetical protein
MDKFVVVAGKYDHDGERNYKYSSEEFFILAEAIADAEKCFGYPFVEIELTTAAGKQFIITPV